jgi:hypothetical protein
MVMQQMPRQAIAYSFYKDLLSRCLIVRQGPVRHTLWISCAVTGGTLVPRCGTGMPPVKLFISR